MSIAEKITALTSVLPEDVVLVAVSKTYPPSDILEAYGAGQRAFGENDARTLAEKYNALPKDIAWHMIGGLQTNKVKYIASFVSMIHSGESEKLLQTIHKEALKHNRVIDLLLEVRIAQEESKHGWQEEELEAYLQRGDYRTLTGIRFRGMMGVATYTDDEEVIRAEFTRLHDLFQRFKTKYFNENFDTLSMGMTMDYPIAIACGSTMVRIGSYIFGSRK